MPEPPSGPGCQTMSLKSLLGNKPTFLEWVYQLTYATINFAHPLIRRLGYDKVEKIILPIERISKESMFGCQMCGQCILHSTGMVCPMTCPKNLRNGACGGVRSNGNCEIIPDMKCVWVDAFDKAQSMQVYGPEIITIKPPVNHDLEGSSAWINLLTGEDEKLPEGWKRTHFKPVVERKFPTSSHDQSE